MEHRVTKRPALSSAEARGFQVAGRELVLYLVDDEVLAMDGYCTHEKLPLDGGEIEDGVLECPWHGALYDVCTGAACGLPAVLPLRRFETRVDGDGSVFVELPE